MLAGNLSRRQFRPEALGNNVALLLQRPRSPWLATGDDFHSSAATARTTSRTSTLIDVGGGWISSIQNWITATLRAAMCSVCDAYVEARDILQKEGIPTAVISMPYRLVFEEQDAAYKRAIMGETHARVAVEMGWDRYWASTAASWACTGSASPARSLTSIRNSTTRQMPSSVPRGRCFRTSTADRVRCADSDAHGGARPSCGRPTRRRDTSSGR